MRKQFYSHIVTLEIIRIELEGLVLTPEEKKELLSLAEKQLHHVMLDTALTHIHGDAKKKFLMHIAEGEHEVALHTLRSQVKDVEKHLLHAAHILYESLREDIREIKKQEKDN